MGSRGAFLDVNTNSFSFIEGGQTYFTIGEMDGIKIIVRKGGNSVKAPEYSHTENRVYAVIQDGKLKHISFYDENHKQQKCIDFGHKHGGIQPHYHEYLNHKTGYAITEKDKKIIDKITRRYGIKWN